MWILDTASKLYADAFAVVTGYPVLSAVWTLVVWVAGLIPKKWLIETMRSIWPWDRVPMSSAAAYALGHVEGGFIEGLVRRQANPARMLPTVAHYIADNAALSAIRPPASKRTRFDTGIIGTGVFSADGNSFTVHGAASPAYTDIAITRWRLWVAIFRLRRLDASAAQWTGK